MDNNQSKTYHAAIYLRISNSDKVVLEDEQVVECGKLESYSISNQKELVMDFLRSMPDIDVVSVRIDDGYSGVDFNRPEFQMMLEDIKKGIVDCVIVKDLSRFGRNYIETGRYLEKIFPMFGVRFISINDYYDSNYPNGSQDILLAFKNLINDSYLRDLSIKIRSHLEIKRKNGEFIGAFACYGYLKEEKNKNQLVIDCFAAEIIKDIFRMKMDGLNPHAIAAKLNDSHILSPMEYKKSIGSHFKTSFKLNEQAAWSAQAVLRILTNEVYTGVLLQGKQTTPNHKVKVRAWVDNKDWIRVENAHEPIIDKFYFDAMQTILERDTRTSPSRKNVYPLCGLVFCGDCGAPMIRKTNTSRKQSTEEIPKKYFYFLCRTSQKEKACSGHRLKEEELLEAVFEELKFHIQSILNVKDALDRIENVPSQQFEIKKLKKHIKKKKEECDKAKKLKDGIYEDLKDEILDREEYERLRTEFDERIFNAKQAIVSYQKEIHDILNYHCNRCDWKDYFKKYISLPELSRKVATIFIDRILVYEDNRIKIKYTFEDSFAKVLEQHDTQPKINTAGQNSGAV